MPGVEEAGSCNTVVLVNGITTGQSPHVFSATEQHEAPTSTTSSRAAKSRSLCKFAVFFCLTEQCVFAVDVPLLYVFFSSPPSSPALSRSEHHSSCSPFFPGLEYRWNQRIPWSLFLQTPSCRRPCILLATMLGCLSC